MDLESVPRNDTQRISRNRVRRTSEPGHPSTRPNLERVDSNSDPGHGYSNFFSADKPQTVPIADQSRPFTQGSTTSRNEAGLSYAETSSATQSYVSMDSQSGPTDTPHPSVHSVQRIEDESDSEGDVDNDESLDRSEALPSREDGDDTVRQPAVTTPRSTLQDIIQPNKLPSPVHDIPDDSVKNMQEIPPKAESVHSLSLKASTSHTSPPIDGQSQSQRISTSSRHESTTSGKGKTSKAATPSERHTPLAEPSKSIGSSPRITVHPLRPPSTTKIEPDHAPSNGIDPSAGQQRPPMSTSASQMDTQYVNMLLALDGIPPLHNILAGFFTWILLAGFVLFPGTFTSLQEANGEGLGVAGIAVLGAVQHLPLYVIAWICTGVGASGMCWLWYRWQANYIWLVNRIFMPGLLNSLAGVLSTLVNVLGVHHATFSVTSKSTIVVTSVVAGICGCLTGFYTFFLIRNVKKKHDEEIGKQRAGKHGEGFVDVSKRKVARKVG